MVSSKPYAVFMVALAFSSDFLIQRCVGFGACFIEIHVINVHPPLPLSLIYKHDIEKPLNIFNFGYKFGIE